MAGSLSTADSHIRDVAEFSVTERHALVGLEADDVARITTVRDAILPRVDAIASAFFERLAASTAAADLFRRRSLVDDARRMKRAHLIAMVSGDYGRAYIEERIELGLLYSRAGLDGRSFMGAFLQLLQSLGDIVMTETGLDSATAWAAVKSLNKVAFLDLAIILDVMLAERERTIFLQQAAIRELSTPTLQIRERLLILPIIGLLDSDRAKRLTDGLLHAIRANRAKVVVVDITGVVAIDSRVANHLVQTAAAARLMGASVIITGLSAEVAQTLVTLGVDLGRLATVGDLQGGLEEAERMLGYKVVRLAEPGI